jgi:hypothetical protein
VPIRVARKLKGTDVIDVLSDLFILRGVPGHVRSDNGPEFIGRPGLDHGCGRQDRLHRSSSPWENGYIESFNSKLRDGLLNGEIFYTLKEAKIVIEAWRKHYNTIRPHSSLGCIPPAPEVVLGRLRKPHQLRPPPQLSRSGRHCTNLQPGPPNGGRPFATAEPHYNQGHDLLSCAHTKQ